MNIVKTFEQFNNDFVYFCEPIKNNIMNDGNFIRIIYSSPFFVLNGIYLLIQINQVTVEKHYNKYKCIFDVEQHKDIVEKMKCIEEDILKKANIQGKTFQMKIYEQLKNGNIKMMIENTDKPIQGFVIKIAGLWETDAHYGLTYKFLLV